MTRNEIQNTLSDFCKMLSICQLCPTIIHFISYSLFLAKNTVMTNCISQRKFHDQYVSAKPLLIFCTWWKWCCEWWQWLYLQLLMNLTFGNINITKRAIKVKHHASKHKAEMLNIEWAFNEKKDMQQSKSPFLCNL